MGIGLFLLTIAIGNEFIPRDKAVTREMLGHDFLAFYTAGRFVRDGRYHDLYKLDAVKAFEQSTAHLAGLEVGKSFGPWWNPPFYAIVFEPLAALPYAQALDLWRWISVAAVIAAIAILTFIIAEESFDWRTWALVPLLIIVSMPFVQAFSHGQNTFTSLLLLTGTVALWRREKKFLAGLVCGLLFYKPQLAAVVAAILVLDLGWKALAGLSVTGLALLLINMLVLPGSLSEYLHLLPANVHWMQVEQPYLWERHVTLKAFWRLLLQGREAGELAPLTAVLFYLSIAIVAGGLLLAAKRARSQGWDSIQRDRLIAATIAAMPLLMPFYFDYDLLLLAVPFTLYAIERVGHPRFTRPSDRSLTQSAVALCFWLYFNPAVALRTHLNITVLLLSATAACFLRRVIIPVRSSAERVNELPQNARLAA